MRRKNQSYFSYRLKLEKLKQGTWLLVVLARVLFFLGIIASYYYGRK